MIIPSVVCALWCPHTVYHKFKVPSRVIATLNCPVRNIKQKVYTVPRSHLVQLYITGIMVLLVESDGYLSKPPHHTLNSQNMPRDQIKLRYWMATCESSFSSLLLQWPQMTARLLFFSGFGSALREWPLGGAALGLENGQKY